MNEFDEWESPPVPEYSHLPELSHWNLVIEFTVEQAALLLAGIDPIKTNINDAWRCRWGDNAKTYVIAIIGAIRQGLLQPVFCAYREYYEGDYVISEMKPSDRTREISIYDTIVTRNALTSWVERSKLEPISYRLYREKLADEKASNRAPHNHTNNQNDINTRDTEKRTSSYENHKDDEVKYLPKFTHESEGLTYLQKIDREFWSTWEEDNPSTLPNKKEVIDYLAGMGVSKNMSEAVDMILRPINQRRAHLKNNKLPTRESQ